MHWKMWRSVLMAAIMIGVAAPAAADTPTIEVEVIGPDGKPVPTGKIGMFSYGDRAKPIKTATPGEIVEMRAKDDQSRGGSKVVRFPKDGSIKAVIKVASGGDAFWPQYLKAEKAQAAGDTEALIAHASEAEQGFERDQDHHDH